MKTPTVTVASRINNQGRFSQAISDYNKAIDIDPSYAEAYLNRGWAYYNQGEPTQLSLIIIKPLKSDLT